MRDANDSACLTWCGLLAMLFCTTASAQFRAGIQGTVLDASGAAVPGAKVTLTNEETAVTRETQSGPEGFYRLSSLAPGRYTISAEAVGFQKAVEEHFEVRAEQVEGVNLTLTPGQVTESVTVSAENAPQLQTEGANIDGTITVREVQRLPQSGRDPYELVRLTPGVFGLGARDGSGNSVAFPNSSGPGGSNSSIFQTENQVPISANGQRLTANGFQIDGVNVNSQAWGGAAVITPSQESVKEIRVVSSSYSAENGRNSGALIQVVSQNGTNQFHGSFFGKVNNPALNAYQRWGGPHGESPQRVENDLVQWGGSLGGPILKNRLFFFFSHERFGLSSSSLESHWIETPEFVNLVKGLRPNTIASQILSVPGISQDPRISRILPGTCATIGLADPTLCRQVQGGLDIGSPTGAPGLIIPNGAGGGLDGIPDVRFAEMRYPQNQTNQQYNGRLDYQVTQKDLVAFSEYFVPFENKFNQSWANDARPIEDWTSSRRNMDAALLWTRTISPTAVNEARFNVTRWYFNEIQSNPKAPWGIPRDSVCDSHIGCINWGLPGPGVFYQTTYNFRDTLTKVVKSHVLKFGFDVAREQNNDTVAWAARPSYDFGNLWNFVNDAPLDENGNFDPRNGHPTDLKKYIRAGDYALFVQDDWKVRPNLTLNLGLRWEYFTPLREKYGNISNALLGSGPNPLTGARMKIGGDLYNPDRNNFGPQFGFAWNPKEILAHDFQSKLVLRGGFGLGFNRIPESLSLNGRLNPPFFGSFNLSQNQVVYSLSTAGVKSFQGWPANPATLLTFDPSTNFPIAGPNLAKPDLFGLPQSLPTPYTYRYSLELQYELGGNWMASLGYQGSTSHKLPRTVNYSLFFDPNPAINSFKFMQNDINSNFNALLARVTHRFSKGLEFNAQYRWSKSIDTCSNDDKCGDIQTYPFDLKTEHGPSDFDVRHAFVASGLWDLPIFRTSKGWAGKIAGGWQLNGILTANSGFPWTAVYSGDNCVQIKGRGGLCPQRPIAYLGGARSDAGNETFLRADCNFPGGGSKYFVPPPGGSALIPPPPGIGRNTFRGPRYFDTDLSAVKRMGLPRLPLLREGTAVELRANLFNVFNKLNLKPFGFGDNNTQVNRPEFGRALGALSGRVVEFQARFSF